MNSRWVSGLETVWAHMIDLRIMGRLPPRATIEEFERTERLQGRDSGAVIGPDDRRLQGVKATLVDIDEQARTSTILLKGPRDERPGIRCLPRLSSRLEATTEGGTRVVTKTDCRSPAHRLSSAREFLEDVGSRVLE